MFHLPANTADPETRELTGAFGTNVLLFGVGGEGLLGAPASDNDIPTG